MMLNWWDFLKKKLTFQGKGGFQNEEMAGSPSPLSP